MAKISTYPDGGEIQVGDQFVVSRAGANKSILGGKIANRTAFTPTLSGTTIAGAGTYTDRLGYYSRIGNICFIEIQLTWTAHTGTGNMKITGLPFTCVNIGINPPLAVHWDSITLTAVGNKVMAIVVNNSTEISLREIASGAAALIPIDTAAGIILAGFYFIA